MRYLRIGELPPFGKSINFFKISLDLSAELNDFIGYGDVDRFYKELVPQDALEAGVSVFELEEDNMPVISNMRLINSLAHRLMQNEVMYIVSGKEVDRGNDSEPIISDVKIESSYNVSKEDLLHHILQKMNNSFKTVIPKQEDDTKISFHLGISDSAYYFNGWTFSDPIDGFDDSCGVKGRKR